MSKVTIKFWDIAMNDYVSEEYSDGLFVNIDGEVFQDCDDGLAFPVGCDYEAHFFLDRRRIA